MADLHVDNTGSNTAPYDTWAKAATTFATAAAAAAAGDTIYVASTHAEATSMSAVTVPGSHTALTRVICGTKDVTSGITAVATGAVIESNGATFSIQGTFYAEGITWKSSAPGVNVSMLFATASGGAAQRHKDCTFWMNSDVNSTVRFGVGSASISNSAHLDNPTFRFGNASQKINADGFVLIRRGSISASGSAPTGLFGLSSQIRCSNLLVFDFDATNGATAMNIIPTSTQSGAVFRGYRWKMPASWSGAIFASGIIKRGDRGELFDYSIGSTLYDQRIEDYGATQVDESTIKVTAHSKSYKLTSGTDCGILASMRSRPFVVPLSGTGAQTLKVDVCTDGVTLTDADCFLEVEYFAASGTSLGSVANDAPASSIAAPSNQASSSTTWTTTGLASPVRQELSVSVTAGRASHCVVQVVLRKASTTVYIDNEVQVS